MRYFRKPINDKNFYYIKYRIDNIKYEFWTDLEEEFKEKMKFISLHHDYHLIMSSPPLTIVT
jgi:hypothetical protein